MRQSFIRISQVLALCALTLALGCKITIEADNDAPVEDYITRVTTSNSAIVAEVHSGAPPEAGTGPTINASASAGVTLLGGSQIYNITANSAFTTVVVWVEGIEGYYTLTGLPIGMSTSIIVTVSQAAPNTFEIGMAAGTSGATAVGQHVRVPVQLLEVGTGDVQVSLAWDKPSDIDLYVVEPSGEEIYYGHKSSATGGTLDLDSNAACSIDHKNNENITWEDGAAPRGTYTVRVNNYSACSQTNINCVITINVSGKAPVTYTHTFTDSGSGGSSGAGTVIAEFSY